MHNRVGITASNSTRDVYRIDKTGQIFQYIGWKRLECEFNTVSLSAADFLYRLDTAGYIYKFLPNDSTWLRIDDNGQAKAITSGGPYVYKLHEDGSIWKFDGSSENPGQPWIQIDDNPKTIMISAEGSNIYLMHMEGDFAKFSWFHGRGWAWDRIDNDTNSKLIIVGWRNVYKMRYDGSIWRREPHGRFWEELDVGHRNTAQITAGAAGLFQRRSNPEEVYAHVQEKEWVRILQLSGTPGEVIVDISSGNDGLYLAKENGEMWRYDINKKKWFNLLD